MKVTRRTKGLSYLGFGLVAMLVIGGLAWASVASLRLQQVEAENQRKSLWTLELRPALWRMDNLVMQILNYEERRDYVHYRWSYCSPNLSPEPCVGPSPIAVERESDKTPDWILMHFQLSAADGWQSPQEAGGALGRAQGSVVAVDPPRELPLLAELRRQLSVHDLSRLVSAHGWFSEISGRSALRGESLADGSRGAAMDIRLAGGPVTPTDAVDAARGEFNQRAQQRQRAGGANVPEEQCEPAELAFNSLFDLPPTGLEPWDDADEESMISVQVSPMVPIWLQLEGAGPLRLAFVRRVDVGDNPVFQGFLVDWQRLGAILLSVVRDRFPAARLIPVEQGPVSQPEVMMSTIPARLDTGNAEAVVQATGWTFLHLWLAIAWVAAFTVLGAVGVGTRALLGYAERRMEFAYAVTHELRTPLTTLRLYTDMLAHGDVTSEETRQQYFETLDRETERLSGLVAGVMEYARVENRSVKVDRREITLGELVETAKDRCDPVCERAGQHLVTDVNGLSTATVETDPRLVLQIIDILVDNACKYGVSETDPRVILRAVRPPNRMIGIEVEDHGPGVPASVRRRIFKPFRRGRDADIPQTCGLGLGLALARRWAKLLGGGIELAPPHRPGAGACFRITFPEVIRREDSVDNDRKLSPEHELSAR